MCIAAPGKIIKIDGKKAIVQYRTENRIAFITDVPVNIGDYVLVQMGIVIKIMTPQEAKIALKAWKNTD